jgi:sec-independent protein translocase protein TatA
MHRAVQPEESMFGGKLGLPELLVIVFIALLIFGPKKLGELGKGLGEGIRNFKSSMNDGSSNNSTTTSTTTTKEEKK